MKYLQTIVIPSFQPDGRLVTLVGELIETGFEKILVIDDGSDLRCESIFSEIKKFREVTLLRNAVNLGKGAALKMAMNHLLVSDPKLTGIITVDGDGQHKVEDVLKLAKASDESSDLLLGARRFEGNVPWRSRFGNIMTKWVFRLLVGKKLNDTQTGLRAIPRRLMRELLSIASNRYEFELDMLILAVKEGIPVSEVPISTIYENNNSTSHFNPFLDSFRIYFVFLRFVSLSLLVYATDLLIFTLAYRLSSQMLSSIVFGRLAGAAVGMVGSRSFVFKSDKRMWDVIFKLVALWFFLLGASYGLMLILVGNVHLNVYASRVTVDSALFVINFLIQRDIIFSESAKVFNPKNIEGEA